MLYNTPNKIKDIFTHAANDTANGKNVKWHSILVLCGLIDDNKSSKNNIVFIKPSSQHQYNDLKQKTEWLRPFIGVDPLVSTIVTNMDKIFNLWKNPL